MRIDMAQETAVRAVNGHSATSHTASTSSTKLDNHSSSSSKNTRSVPLTAALFGKFEPQKRFGAPLFKPENTVTSLAFDDRGDYLVSAGSDETIHIFSCSKGKHAKTLYSKKYGVQLARFTHTNKSIVYASTKEDDTIRHHSLLDNTYLQYFRGHQSKVTSLQVSPVNDTFLSAALDESVRLWDLRSQSTQGQFPLKGRPVLSWDPAGDVFALGAGEAGVVLLYDQRSFSPQPLLTTRLKEHCTQVSADPFITFVAFHPSGKMLLVGTANDALFVLDAYESRILYSLQGHESFKQSDGHSADIEACGQEMGWTPDGQYIYASSQSKGIQIWQVPDSRDAAHAQSSEPLPLRPSFALAKHPGTCARAVAFNPRFAMMASAAAEVALWLPPDEDDNA